MPRVVEREAGALCIGCLRPARHGRRRQLEAEHRGSIGIWNSRRDRVVTVFARIQAECSQFGGIHVALILQKEFLLGRS